MEETGSGNNCSNDGSYVIAGNGECGTRIDYNRKGSITINKTTNVEKKNTDGTNKNMNH